MSNRKVMIVEDNPADAVLTERMLVRMGTVTPRQIQVVPDGEDAIASLTRRLPPEDKNDSSGLTIPDLILLDLNLPGLSGLDFLKRLRSLRRFDHLPVIVVSSSSAPGDVTRAYRAGANAYVKKPVDLDGYRSLIEAIDRFWLKTCLLPA